MNLEFKVSEGVGQNLKAEGGLKIYSGVWAIKYYFL